MKNTDPRLAQPTGPKQETPMKRSIKFSISMMTTLVILGIAGVAFGQPGEAEVAAQKSITLTGEAGWIALAAGIGLGLAALGGALGQGRAAAAALDGIARNPGAADKIRGPMILGLALIESLVIYSLIIAFLLFGKIG
jgi:F-type H+-transporting ATPase subunit c